MSETELFPATGRWRAAMPKVGGIEKKFLGMILSRTIKALPRESGFDEQAQEKLQEVLGLSETDVRLVLDTVSFIYQQASYAQLSGAALREELGKQQSLGLSEEAAELLVAVWEDGRAALIARCKALNLAPLSLEAAPWQLHLRLAQSNLTGLKEPTAIFQLSLRDRDRHLVDATVSSSAAAASPAARLARYDEALQFEMDHAQLFAFYSDLERIQEQLDRLSSRS